MIPSKIKSLIKNSRLKWLYRDLYLSYDYFKLRHKYWNYSDWDYMLDNFYRSWMHPLPGLVFDIGAGIGRYTKAYHLLGAEVVAVEPIPTCSNTLKKLFKKVPTVHVISAAISDTDGKQVVYEDIEPAVSSLYCDFCLVKFSTQQPKREICVDVLTIDSMIGRFGIPDFLKIDVEGWENRVLNGLSVPVSAVSFEFSHELQVVAIEAIDKIESLARYKYQFAADLTPRFSLPDWVSAQEMKDAIPVLGSDYGGWGDIYALRTT